MSDQTIPQNFEARQEFVASTRSHAAQVRDEELRRLADLQAAAHNAHQATVAAAVEAAAAKDDELDAALARDVAALWPMVSDFCKGGDQRRAHAVTIAESWRAWDAQCRQELGCPVEAKLLALAFSATHSDFEARAAANGALTYAQIGGQAMNATAKAIEAILTNAPVPVLVAALEQAELMVTDQINRFRYAPSPARARAMRSRVTPRGIAAALAAADRIQVEEETRPILEEDGPGVVTRWLRGGRGDMIPVRSRA